MRLLRSRKLELQSPLSPEASARLIAECVEPRRWFSFGSDRLPFQGTVTGLEFDIRRVITSLRVTAVDAASPSRKPAGFF